MISTIIIANANTFVYMSDERRVGNSESEFAPFTGSCDGFNDWSFGLEDLFDYPSRWGAEQIEEAYGQREVVYLLGDQDNDPNDLTTTCQGLAQGTTRFERGKIYYNHILDHFGVAIQALHQLTIVPGEGHDHAKMYQSEEGLSVLFDQLPTTQCETITSLKDALIIPWQYYPNPASEQLIVRLDHGAADHLNVIISNNRGQTIYSNVINQNISIDISSLLTGIYFLTLQSDKIIQVNKLVIMR